MSQYFPKPFNWHFDDSIKIKIDLSNYSAKSDIKNILHLDTSSFALKTNLATLKSRVNKLDIDKLKPVPTDLSKLSNLVKNNVVKKDDYINLATKIDNVDTSGLVKMTDYNTKITEIEGKIPDISNLATKTALTTVENKIPSISNLKKQTIILKLLILKINLIIMIMINILILESLINSCWRFYCENSTSQFDNKNRF